MMMIICYYLSPMEGGGVGRGGGGGEDDNSRQKPAKLLRGVPEGSVEAAAGNEPANDVSNGVN